jgi:hypothetical protein
MSTKYEIKNDNPTVCDIQEEESYIPLYVISQNTNEFP